MGTKNKPASFDCYANAEPDEPMFVLLARDVAAPRTVRHWALARCTRGKNKLEDAKMQEALACADAMEKWREAQKADTRKLGTP